MTYFKRIKNITIDEMAACEWDFFQCPIVDIDNLKSV